jgi:glycosyltransferase involved in cell wall biosynthesis
MKLSLIVPCYNEERTIRSCLDRVFAIVKDQDFNLEVVVVNDASTDNSLAILNEIKNSALPPKIDLLVFSHEKNMGKGAALKKGLEIANGDYIGIQDADNEYEPNEYLTLLKPLLEDKADVVYGSRYLKQEKRKVLYWWHTCMNKTLTMASNMITNLDLTDMETCYKLFKREAIKKIAPTLRENRFGFEPEITAKIAIEKFRVYECAITYNPRTYEEGKKINWKDGARALYCVLHYGAYDAPLPMQIILYLLIGAFALSLNVFSFAILNYGFNDYISQNHAIWIAFVIAAVANYILCIAILFRHKARFSAPVEIIAYIFSVALMGVIDYIAMKTFLSIGLGAIGAKFWASIIGFVGNFALRKWFVFSKKKIGGK